MGEIEEVRRDLCFLPPIQPHKIHLSKEQVGWFVLKMSDDYTQRVVSQNNRQGHVSPLS